MVELMIRQPALAGTWYSGEPVALRSELNLHLAAVPRTAVPGLLIGLVAPHAGLMYSGRVAAHCFALLRESANPTVVLLGPSHHLGFDGIAVYERGAWDTPLGRTLVNEEVASALLQARAPFFSGADKHRYEHALEMQLPFLQYVAPHARIVPLLMGWQSQETIDAAAAALGALRPAGDIVLLASSDLSHYHDARTAQALDSLVVDDVNRFDAGRLQSRLSNTPEHACGGGPLVSVMKAAGALGANQSTALRYGHSGEAGGRDASRVVGYLAAAFWRAA